MRRFGCGLAMVLVAGGVGCTSAGEEPEEVALVAAYVEAVREATALIESGTATDEEIEAAQAEVERLGALVAER